MAKKKKKISRKLPQKKIEKVKKLDNKNQSLETQETEKVSKKIAEKENRQLFWVIAIIFFAFAVFLGTYFYLQSLNNFQHSGVQWFIEDHSDMNFYHARFQAFGNPLLNYNLYLRNDPRENDVKAEGDFSYFKRTTYISFSPEVDECRGDIPVAVVNLASFLSSAVGVEKVEPATTSPAVYYETGRAFADCNTIDGGIIVIEKGESSVIQSEEKPFCYTIKINDCEDIKPLEKFITKTINEYYSE